MIFKIILKYIILKNLQFNGYLISLFNVNILCNINGTKGHDLTNAVFVMLYAYIMTYTNSIVVFIA